MARLYLCFDRFAIQLCETDWKAVLGVGTTHVEHVLKAFTRNCSTQTASVDVTHMEGLLVKGSFKIVNIYESVQRVR